MLVICNIFISRVLECFFAVFNVNNLSIGWISIFSLVLVNVYNLNVMLVSLVQFPWVVQVFNLSIEENTFIHLTNLVSPRNKLHHHTFILSQLKTTLIHLIDLSYYIIQQWRKRHSYINPSKENYTHPPNWFRFAISCTNESKQTNTQAWEWMDMQNRGSVTIPTFKPSCSCKSIKS